MRMLACLVLVLCGCREPALRTVAAPAPAHRPDAAVVPADAAVVAVTPDAAAPPPPPLSTFTQPRLAAHVALCAGVTCGGHGQCEPKIPMAFPEVVASCACDAGYYAAGLECRPCRVLGADAVIDVAVATWRGRVLLGGKPLPEVLHGEVVLVGEGTPDTLEIVLGRDRFDVTLVAGRYDVIYREKNKNKVIASRITIAKNLDVRGTLTRDIVLPFKKLTGSIKSDPSDVGSVLLQQGDDRMEVVVDKRYTTYVPAGTYDVRYLPGPSHSSTAPQAPAIVRRGVKLTGGTLDLEIPVVTVRGTIAGSLGDAKHISFGGHPIAVSANGTFTAQLVPGTYDVAYSFKVDDGHISATIARGIAVDGKTKLELVVPRAAKVDGRFLLDGHRIPYGVVRGSPILVALPDNHTYGYAHIMTDVHGFFTTMLAPGDYMMAYAYENEMGIDSVMPVERITVSGDMTWTYNLPVVELTGTQPDARSITFSHWGNMRSHRFDPPSNAWRFPPGVYSINLGEFRGIKRGVSITKGGPFTFDTSTRPLDAKLTLGGKPARSSLGRVALDGVSIDAMLATGRLQANVPPRSYGVFYRNRDGAAGEPINRAAYLGCVTVK